MFENLARYVTALPAEALPGLGIENAAVCEAWYASLAQNDGRTGRYAGLPETVAAWHAEAAPAPQRSQGRRMQPLVRMVVDVLLAEGADHLLPDDLELLWTVWRFVTEAGNRAAFRRLETLLDAHAPAIVERRKGLAPEPGLPGLATQCQFITDEDIQEAPARQKRLFPGAPLPARGPFLTHGGPVKVLGAVPEECTVVVERGSCTVEGYVLGRVVAKHGCEIGENVAGEVFVHEGDVRCRNVIDNAFVVAKAGEVRFNEGQNPRQVFAGRAIHGASTRRGKYFAPQIHIAGEALGGEYHASEIVEADRFAVRDAHALSIVLRRGLSCEDYGEETGPETRRLLSRAARLRQRLDHIAHIVETTRREAKHCGASALLYLSSGDKAMQGIEEKRRIEKRLAVVNRIVAGLYVLTLSVEDRLILQARQDAQGTDGTPPVQGSLLQDVEADLEQFSAEYGLDIDLARERQEIVEIDRRLAMRQAGKRPAVSALIGLRQRLDTWVRERKELGRRLERLEASLQAGGWPQDLPEPGGDSAMDLQSVRRRLAEMRARPPTPVVRQRAATPFVAMMLKNLENRLLRIDQLERNTAGIRRQLTGVSEKLRRDYTIVLDGGETDSGHGARAEGRFEAGVTLSIDPFPLEDNGAAKGSVVVTSESGRNRATYVRGMGRILEGPQ